MKPTLIVTLALVASACGKKKPDAATGSGEPSTNAAVPPGGTMGVPDDPTPAVVREAFAGKPPVLPQLSKTGDVAAAELVTHVGLTGATTYGVGYMTTSGSTDQVTLVDAKLAKALADAPKDTATIDRDSLRRTAATITKRLNDDAFTPFGGKVDELAHGDPETVGPGKLQLVTSENDALVITVFDATGKQIASETIKPTPMGKVDELECVSVPLPRGAYFDTARHRILLRIGWNAGPDQCDAPDPQYRLYAIP
jgi:hypothetical protein